MWCERLLCGVALAAVFGAGTAQGQDIPASVHAVPATILQVLKTFDNPEGSIFSADGQSVFVSNSAEIGDKGQGFGFTEGEGYISKLAVQPNGTLVMVNERLIEGLTAPLGMAVLPVATGKFPAGTIFALAGSAPLVDAQGQVVKDPTHLRTKLIGFNDNGKILGEIDTGQGSLFERINGAPIVLINALGFDAEGNAYVADTAFGADQFDPPFAGKSGLWLIPHGALDALADGQEPSEAPVFIEIPGNPDGVEVSPVDGKIYVNTVGPVGGAPDPADGGIYALTKDDIANNKLPPPVEGGLGALDGLDFTAGGAMLNTQIKDDRPSQIYINCPGKGATTLALAPGGTSSDLNGPADVAVRRSGGGVQLVIVPELFARAANAKTDEVTVLALPAGFDAACSG
jgi:DNA-binding beta-propeller fold protein YncE